MLTDLAWLMLWLGLLLVVRALVVLFWKRGPPIAMASIWRIIHQIIAKGITWQ